MSEVGYFLEKWRGNAGLQIFLDDIRDGIYTLYCDETNVDRISELTRRYRDLRLGYADAAVIACAERHGGRVATLDHRHFGVVAREGTIQIVP
jgi:predicted nucleic acid-binding protein